MTTKIEFEQTLKKLKDIETALNESSIVAITDQKGIIQFVNNKFCEISQYHYDELVGNDHRIVNSGFHSKEFMKDLWKTIGNGKVWRGEFRNKAKDGSYYWVDTTIVPFLNDQGKPYQYISIRHDITIRKNMEEEIKWMAYRDTLTSLPNRNYLSHWIKEELNDKNNHKLAVLFLDLDRFKSINDTLGHDVGDLLLREASQRLKNCLRKSDFIARLGGDEFVIVLKDIENQKDVVTVVNKIKKQLHLPFTINKEKLVISTSIGISMDILSGDSVNFNRFIETLMKKADIAMYHAKQKGGNTYCFNTDNQTNELERFYHIEQEITKALEQNQFSVVYQPLVNLKDSKIVGMEALLRWSTPTLGSVSPDEFIPILEQLGYINEVGKWVLHAACRQMKIWLDNGLELERISVNVSPVQFSCEHFLEKIKETLIETGLEACFLELEVTEGTILSIKESLKTLNELKSMGVKISIDDFGTGYSSLSYLKNLPISSLKIDKSFINDLDIDSEVIVNTIINLGKNLNFTVIAEGIENQAQLSYLQHQHCQLGQGYYFSKPVRAEEIPRIIKEYQVVSR
ncbi:sensor domain-containing protein [Halalkalibacter krulwichiae]|uniref:Phytochrome-like protein cph2 n=1 Tax=Halalkalibacter krulwichiae TaxID=199441 RepID=A0A1X9MAP0_9BACI|nr:GGDEF domain-containing phosphodiesterase [Halalkalibacter krulwichiae]ARK29714.1 Phytochrome-like protein cph2 [Halalkalibacter krulwichiae]